ncbi:MAG: DUF1127 domain-containing protein [Proteobacteria bacterium]|nr:DUF1127 domain-containing protein [Pseudomonadota bacterium]
MTTPTYDNSHPGHGPAAFVPEPKGDENAHSDRRSPFATIAAWFSRLVDTIERANRRKVLHQQLITLDDHLLADIGIHRGEIPRLVAGSYRTYTHAPEIQSAATRPDPLTIEEDLAVIDVPANAAETPRAA